MENKSYFRLGLFVLTAVVLCLIGIGFLIGPRAFQPSTTIETYFRFSISGLDVGAPLKFRGIEIGQVTEILLSTEAYPHAHERALSDTQSVAVVRAKIYQPLGEVEHEFDEFIARGLRIQTQLAGITGSLYLSLDFLDPKKYPIDRIEYDWTPKYYVVPSAPSLSNEIVENVENFLAGLDDIHLEETLNETIPAINSLLLNLNRISSGLQPDLINNVGNSLSALLKTADTKIAEIDMDQLNQLIAQIDSTTKSLESVAVKTDTQQLVASLTGLSNRLSALLNNNQYDVKQLISNLNRVTENLQGVMRELKDNPNALLSTPRASVQALGNAEKKQ